MYTQNVYQNEMYTQMKMCTGIENVYPNEKCVQEWKMYTRMKMYTQNVTQSKPACNQMKIVCPDTEYTQISSAP